MAISEYSNPIQNTLEQYIPLPLDTLLKAGQAIQQRGDLAQQQNDQVQTGLASMEALAPGHRQFVNQYANDFRKSQQALLDKYNGNTSDPDFIRESRRVNMQFAADPRLKVIQQANELYKEKEKIKSQLEAQGKKYLDSNPNFTGYDSHNNLTSNVGTLTATNFDEDIDKAFKSKEGAIEQVGTTMTNRHNLQRVLNGYLASWNTNPEIQQGLQYYRQKGYTEDQAKAAMINTLKQGLGYAHDQKDHFYEQMAWEKSKFAMEHPVQPTGIPNLLPFSAERSPLVESTIHQDKLRLLDRTLGNTNENGGIKKGTFEVDDTPQNRKLYAGKYVQFNNVDPDALGTDQGLTKKLQVTGTYNQDESKLVDEAREMLGSAAKYNGHYLSDKSVLSKYKDVLSKQSMAYNYIKPNNKDYVEAMENVQIGKKGENIGPEFTILKSDGTIDDGSKKGTNPLKNIKDGSMSIGGINPAPFGKYQYGTIKINAVDKDGNPVEILKPLDKYQQSMMAVPNQIYQLLNSDKSNEDLSRSPIVAPNGQQIYLKRGVDPRTGTLGISAHLGSPNGTELDVDRIINDQMGVFYNAQRPYEKLK